MKGYLCIYQNQTDVIAAARKLRHLKISKMDAFSPFPIHGLDPAMGIKKSWMSAITLFVGLTGGSLALLFQYWAMSIDWQINVGGKPAFSWPSFVPIVFEATVLLGGVATALALFGLIIKSNFKKPIYDLRFTDDRFGLLVCASDPNFQANQVESVLRECNAEEIRTV